MEERRPRWLARLLKSSDAAITAAAAGALILAAAVAFMAFRGYAESVERQAVIGMRASAESRRAEIEMFLRKRRGDAQILAIRLTSLTAAGGSTPGIFSEASADAVMRVLAQTRSVYDYRDIRLIDAAGRVVLSVTDDGNEPIETETYHEVLNSGRLGFVDVHLSGGGKTSFGIVEPLFRGGNAASPPIGAVYLEVDLDSSLTPIMAEWSSASSSEESVLVRGEKHGISFLTPLRKSPGAASLLVDAPSHPERFIGAQISGISTTTLIDGEDYRGEHVIGAATPVAGTPWYVVVKADHDEIEAPVDAIRLATLSIMVVLVALLFIGARLIWQSRKSDYLAARLASDARYRAAVESSIDGYIVANDDGVIIEANDAILGMMQYPREQFIGCRIQDIQARVTAEQCTEDLSRILEQGEARLQTQWRCADASIIDLSMSLIYVRNGESGAFHGFVHDIGPELAARRRVERLNAFYIFLSHVNASIFNLSRPQDILDAVCHTAVRDGDFALVWAGFMEPSATTLRPASVYGDAADYVKTLQITVDPVLPTSKGPTRECMIERRIVSVNDFQSDPSTAAWHEKGRRYGIQAAAAVPILVDGEAVAAITFYARERNYFDSELCALLEETSRNISLALQAVAAEREREAAETARRESEERFMRVFDASPFPMQILSLPDMKLRAINRAHERVFGYSHEEIADQATWQRIVYPDPAYCEQVRLAFAADIQRAIAGGPSAVIESPEVAVRCKDGTTRTARGSMTVAGGDIIIQWVDLTEIKQRQADLIEGERRFRGMIEQTLSGVYVATGERIVYANPRLEAILGYHRAEMLGQNPLALIENSQHDVAAQLFASLSSSAAGISGSLAARRKDGAQIILGLHATRGTWDGAPADIVMVQDVTESKRAEEKIAAYIRQLEGTMRGTLQAVANMVDLRDPYTSGHERRVGIIASDIAREFGWSEVDCENLQLIGLVHDIGKIAIPAEILSKPARLTPLEYAMIKSHAEKGYEILKDVEFPLPIAEIIREHHERMDGSGYPRGLRGQEIRIEARIIAVADVLEAMASHRPYRPSLGVDAALAELESHRGSWFDGDVVDATVRLVREKGYQLPA